MKAPRFTLIILLFILGPVRAWSQNIPYGNNPEAGKYHTVRDGTKLYYEIYGSGEPFVLLHGGVYGYIDEFRPFIDKLKDRYQVICIATRGHGKSEAGHPPFTWDQRASDAVQVIESITKDSAIVLGFSDGGYAAYKLAALYPKTVKKLIVIGAADRPAGRAEKVHYTSQELLKNARAYFELRLAMMPQPDRWNEILSELNKLYNDQIVSKETFTRIKCPVLVMSGDADDGHPIDAVASVAKMIGNAQLSIIPGCHHVVFYCNFPAVWESMVPFLK